MKTLRATLLLVGSLAIGLLARQTTPTPPPARPPISLEQLAYDNTMKIEDAAKRLDALQRLLDNPTFRAHGIARMADDSLFNLLVTKFPDRKDEIAKRFDAVVANLDGASRRMTTDQRLSRLGGYVATLVDNAVFLDKAGGLLTGALEAVTFSEFAESQKANAAGVKNPVPTDAELQSQFAVARGRAVEVLGRLHLAQGDADRAAKEFGEALAASPTFYQSSQGLAEIETRRGHDAAALDHRLMAALSGHLKPNEDAAMRALYAKVHGSEAGLEDALDQTYRARFPNPVKPEPYTKAANRSNRVVLAEMFTGSGCAPCVSADLALDAIADRYRPEDVIVLAYHANIPQPDPMVVAGGDARRGFYKVTGVPTIQVDGVARVGGGPREDAPVVYAEYIAMVDKALAAPASAVVSLRTSRNASGINVTATISGLPADVKNPRLYLVLAERELRFTGENGVRFHRMVVRAVAGEKADDGTGIALAGSGSATVEHTFTLTVIPADLTKTLADEMVKRRKVETPGSTPREYRAEGHAMTAIDPSALVVVAYVQDADRKVLQAARVELTPAAPRRQ